MQSVKKKIRYIIFCIFLDFYVIFLMKKEETKLKGSKKFEVAYLEVGLFHQ